MEKDEHNTHRTTRWIKRLGLAGLLFFTIKGMLWLIVPTALLWWGFM